MDKQLKTFIAPFLLMLLLIFAASVVAQETMASPNQDISIKITKTEFGHMAQVIFFGAELLLVKDADEEQWEFLGGASELNSNRDDERKIWYVWHSLKGKALYTDGVNTDGMPWLSFYYFYADSSGIEIVEQGTSVKDVSLIKEDGKWYCKKETGDKAITELTLAARADLIY